MTHIPPYIESLAPYEPGKSVKELGEFTKAEKIIKLASNENPFGPSPKAMKAIQKAIPNLNRYPDGGSDLKKAIAEKYHLHPKNIILGGGSDNIMLAIVRAFVTEGGEVVTSASSFAQYYLMPQSRGAVVKAAPMKNYTYDLQALRQLITDQTQVVFIANPNNPTGTMFPKADWEAFYESLPKDLIVVADDAYAEFVAGDPQWMNSLEYRYDNVITLRTFSKAYGLAGLRLGFGAGHPDLIHQLHKVKLPFEPSALALAAGEAALNDLEFLNKYLCFVKEAREHFTRQLKNAGIQVIPSVANFVMVELEGEAAAERVFKELLKEGVIVRWLKGFGLPKCFRISIGLREENTKCLEVMKSLL